MALYKVRAHCRRPLPPRRLHPQLGRRTTTIVATDDDEEEEEEKETELQALTVR